jgi:cell division protein FtsL
MCSDEKIRLAFRQYGPTILGLLVVFFVAHDIFGTHGFLAMRRTQNEIKKVQTNIEHLKQQNGELSQEVKDLKSDPRAIEKLAREGLGLAKSGEIIIKIPQSQLPPSQDSATKP